MNSYFLLKQIVSLHKKSYLLLLMSAFVFLCCQPKNENDDIDFSGKFLPVKPSNIFEDSVYFNWGSSIVKGEDSLYHLFYSRFPKKYGFKSWRTHSEIAHAVSENASGPYKFLEIVMDSRAPNYWDAVSVHNARIEKYDSLYYLYHIGTNMSGENFDSLMLLDILKEDYNGERWNLLRDNQRIGVASSKSVYGPWTRLDNPIVEPSGGIHRFTANPDITRDDKGKYYMMLKGENSSEPLTFNMTQGIAISDYPDKGFEIKATLEHYLGFEDGFIWFDDKNQRFYSLIHNEDEKRTELITSKNAMDWSDANHKIVMDDKINIQGGKERKVTTVERPFIFFENGKPKVLCMAVKDDDNKSSFCIFIEIEDDIRSEE